MPSSLIASVCRFKTDAGGNIAVIFGLSSIMIFTAMGAGLDLSRAYLAGQKLSQVATLACQYASRPSVVDTSTASYNGTNGGAAYVSQVNGFINTTWQSQNVNLTQTNGSPFSYTQGGAANVNLSATVPTMFMQIVGFTQIPISVQNHCYDKPSSIVQRVPDTAGQYVIQESFEAGGTLGTYKFYLPNGTNGTQTTSTTYSSAVGYTGANGTQWHISGYCVEQDSVGQIKGTVYDGNFSVELDCDNGSGNSGNSAISTLTYLAAGSYELRYAYSSRVAYPDYGYAYICGSAASDNSWANDNNASGGPVSNAVRTNQINAYLDLNTSSNQPPVHTTIDGTQQLAGSNLIDSCVYGYNWLQRSVSISVTTPGYYWLSFAADGTNDSYGGQLDNILLCRVTCPGTVQDNYTTAWAPSTVLFEDTFESPTYSGSPYNTSGNVNYSYGASNYENQNGNGWANAPTNQLPYRTYGCPQGHQCIEIGWPNNSLVSKPFLLVPGYYQIAYNYVSLINFANLGTSVFCGATPAAANISTLSAVTSVGFSPTDGNYVVGITKNDTNTIGLFMSHAQVASTPNRGNSMGSTTSYTNPNGSTSNTPTVAPNAISLTSYSPSATSPLLDICGYATTSQARTVTVFIQKSAYYWMTFSALATNDQYGGFIDDVKITSIGSPYMSSPPSAVTIPVPSPQPSTTINYTGFSITADPLAP